MNTLGIRVTPKLTSFVVLEEDNGTFTVINTETIKIPAALDRPERLKYLRNCVLDILREYDVNTAGIRLPEGNSQNTNELRSNMEGVILEAFSSSTVNSYFTGRKNSIAAKLQVRTSDLGDLISGDHKPTHITNYELLTNNDYREAGLVALGAAL